MVLYQYAIDRWVKPIINRNVETGRAAGVEEGVAKTNREWRAWLARKADAESRGLPFHEPTPDAKRN